MNISIVIPAFNEEKLIRQSLQSIHRARQTFHEAGWQSELIVCDNNSTDRTAELARAEGARVVFEPVNQIGRARNTGAAAAQGEWLLFIDADSQPSPELFRELMDTLNQNRYLAGGCRVQMDSKMKLGWVMWMHAWNLFSAWSKYAAGSFLCCQREAFETVGGFNLKLYAGEEIELCQKLKKLARQRGLKMFFLKKHRFTTSSRKLNLYSTRELLGTAMSALFRKNAVLTDREQLKVWYDGRR